MKNATQELQELKDTCGICGNIHLEITEAQCDDSLHACVCGELISDYGKHICVVELDYISENTCENCKQVTNLNDLNLCEICEINQVANPESDICHECAPSEAMTDGVN